MAKDTFNMFWHGTRLSTLELVCMQSFVDCGHRLRIHTYDETDVPPGAENVDASEILPRERLFYFENSPASFSDIFRYKLLLEQGGWWVDTDVLCLSSDIEPCQYYWAEQVPGVVNNAVLKAPALDPISAKLLLLSEQRAPKISKWGQLGPALLTEVVAGLDKIASGSTGDAYPIHWLQTHLFWLPEWSDTVRRRVQGSTFVHFWRGMFQRFGIDVESAPPEGSFLAGLYPKDVLATMKQQDLDRTRKAISDYLSQEWVEGYWTNKVGRRMDELVIHG